MKKSKDFRREPLTDTQLLMTITICIFVGMYLLAMLIFKGGFLHAQQVFDMLNDNASLIIVSCGLTVVMIGRGIDISVGAVTSFVVMSCVLYLNRGGSLFVSVLIALGIGLAFGIVQGFLISYLEIQPFIVTLAGMFFARGMTTILSVNPQKAAHEGFAKLRETKIVIPWLGYIAKNGKLVPARVELGVVVALCCLLAVFLLLMFHKLGRALYAIGGNPSSALMLGIFRIRIHDAYRCGKCDQCGRYGNERHRILHYRRDASYRRCGKCDRHFLWNDDPDDHQEDRRLERT